MKTLVLVTIALVVMAGVIALLKRRCAPPMSYQAGGIYSVADEKGYRVVKVLVADGSAVHVRLYKNVYSLRPSKIEESELSLGSVFDGGSFGIGHLPLAIEEFRDWSPVLIMRSSVSKDELEGYETWKGSGGGLWEAPK